MSDTHYNNANNIKISPEHLLKDGYFPLRQLSEKYGYSKDHISRLARTGWLQAIRWGNKGDWFVHESSLKKYFQESAVERFRIVHVKAPIALVSKPVLSKNEGSLNADPIIKSSNLYYRENAHSDKQANITKSINAILTLSIVLGGILFFQVVDVPQASTQIWKKAEHSLPGFTKSVSYIFKPNLQHTTASLWSDTQDFTSSAFSTFLNWLFPTSPSPTYVTIEEYNNIVNEYESRITNLENQSIGLTGATGPRGLTGPAGQTIIKETITQSGSSLSLNSILTDISSLNQEVGDLNSKFSALDLQLSTFKLSTFLPLIPEALAPSPLTLLI